MTDMLDTRLHELRHQLLDAARHLAGAKVLAARLYGVGPVTALAMTCWLAGEGRFSSSRKAVRFAGLDVTVYSSDRKGPPGRLSRQGPPVLRWAVYEAGRPTPGPRPRTTGTTPRSRTAATASAPRCPRPARSSARPATSWPSSATTRSPPPETPPCHGGQPVTAPARPGPPQPHSPDGDHRGQLPPSRPSAAAGPAPQGQADGLIRLSGRIPASPGHPINHHVAGAATAPRGPR